ncbi:MAG: chitobiase/beta-hexosaminidase C-terminal domain-containing protein [Treponema sp.]|nr:chitobiase/beta-hexosaminidase C-terminal domain-containing protein [Treponema sp.]
MKKGKIFNVVLSFLFVFSLVFTSCEVGMGTAVDLEAPVLTITSPEKFSYQQLAFTISGTCTDNVKVERVAVTDKETGYFFGNAIIDGENWRIDLELTPEQEGEVTFLCEAIDAKHNSSTHSARSITLLVDQNAPVAKSWYVDRGNAIQTQLETKEFLQALDFNLSRNKNYPQNEEFTLYGSFYDAMGIDTITVRLYEDNNLIIEKTKVVTEGAANYVGEGKSIYSPEFSFTHNELKNKKASLNSGKHYLRVEYYAKDNDDPVHYNEHTVDTEKYILWYPESDYPGVQQITVENGKIRASVGSSIPVDFFDDDGLLEVYCALKNSINGTPETYVETLKSNLASGNKSAFQNPDEANGESVVSEVFASSITDYPKTITAPNIPKQMYLLAAAKDKNNKWNARVIPVEVTDSNKPMLFVESPTENETPTMGTTNHPDSGQFFSFKGYSLDTKGSNYIKIVYEPDTSTSREQKAKALLAQYASDTTAKKVLSTGEVIWYQKITGTDMSSGWNHQDFEIEMDLFSDFKDASGKSTANNSKFFEILLVDTDGNEIYKPFILDGDSGTPLIEIVEPDTELKVHDYTVDDLVIKFRGYKNSGIGMQTNKYKITTKIGDSANSTKTYEYNVAQTDGSKLTVGDDGYASLTIPKATLDTWAKIEAQPTFTFYATDILGNGGLGEDMRSVILSPKPVINSITINKNDGIYKAGDVLQIKVSFSKQVKKGGSSNPRLVLKYSDSDATPKYATYKSGDMSNAFTFTFTVPVGASSDKLICEGFEIASENVLANGATICATELGEGNIYTAISLADKDFGGKTIKLDGKSPKINGINISADDTNDYCTVDKKITAELTMSEPVLVSGSPKLLLKAGSTSVNFKFQKMDGNKLYFAYTVASNSPQGTITYDLGNSFSATDKQYIKDEAGNILDLTQNTTTGNSNVIIDCGKPPTPGISAPAAGTYNTTKTIILTSIETGATAYYSTDGGVSWDVYNDSNRPVLGDGEHDIRVYQTDQAGNESGKSGARKVTIDASFPSVTNFTVDVADGVYGSGSEIPFVLDFSDDILVSAVTDIQLKFTNKTSTVTKTRNLASVPSGGKGSKFTFTYPTQASDDFEGIVVTEIIFADSVKDSFNNVPNFETTPKKLTPSNCTFLAADDGGNREGIILDGVAPTVSGYTPANGGIASMTNNSSGSFKITLTFSEDVFKETGTIILQRKGNWAIPAVMTNEEFLKYYNQMSATNKAIVRKLGSDGDDLKHGRTGIEVGPYRRITHGLKVKGSNYVPDTDTKFVLAYELGLYDGSATLNDGTQEGTFTVTVAQIRAALESVGYHQHKVDVASDYVKVTGNTVEITFAEAIEDGREWELIIPATAFRDNAENFYKGMNVTGSTDTYSLWSNNVAQPVVRVDRYTHGWGAHEPNADGTDFTDITENQGKYKNANPANNTAAKIAPTGYCRARIDCETPGVTIKYSKLGIDGTAWTTTAPAGVAYNANGGTEYRFDNNGVAQTNGANRYTRQILDDITAANINKRGTQTYTANSDIIVGDGNYTNARKDYITAYATKTGFTDSANGYEGIFKTVVYYTASAQTRIINVEGGTAPGGQSCVFGFPLKDATDENDSTNAGRYSKNCYAVNGNTRTQWVFVSYEIVSEDWAILLCNANHSRIYPLNSYGCATYITAMNYW